MGEMPDGWIASAMHIPTHHVTRARYVLGVSGYVSHVFECDCGRIFTAPIRFGKRTGENKKCSEACLQAFYRHGVVGPALNRLFSAIATKIEEAAGRMSVGIPAIYRRISMGWDNKATITPRRNQPRIYSGHTLAEWSEKLGISKTAVAKKIKLGKPMVATESGIRCRDARSKMPFAGKGVKK